MRKNSAFSIAEVLIALSILGILAFLLILSFNIGKNRESFNTAMYDKVYNDAYTAAKANLFVDKKSSALLVSDATSLRDDITSRLDVDSKWNGTQGWSNCGSGIVSAIGVTCANMEGATLNNGVKIAFVSTGGNIENFKNTLENLDTGLDKNTLSIRADDLVGAMLVDLNGNSTPNRSGEDQFVVPVYNDGLGSGIGTIAGDQGVAVTPDTPITDISDPDCENLGNAENHKTCSIRNVDGTNRCICHCIPHYAEDNSGVCIKDCYDPVNNARVDKLKAKDPNFMVDINDPRCYKCTDEANRLNECQAEDKGIWDSVDCKCDWCPTGARVVSGTCTCPSDKPKLNANVCVSCADFGDGSTPVWNGHDCESCPADRPKWNGSSCVACPDFGDGSTPVWNGHDCEPCPAGTFQVSNTCVPCQAGSYQPNVASKECISCPGNTTTDYEGATSVNECQCANINEPCGGGTFNETTCECKCPSKKKLIDGQCKCEITKQDCKPGYYYVESECSCKQCPIGTYSAGATESCTPCPIGYYQDSTGQSQCIECLYGKITAGEKSTSLEQCICGSSFDMSGYYFDENAETCQILCPSGELEIKAWIKNNKEKFDKNSLLAYDKYAPGCVSECQGFGKPNADRTSCYDCGEKGANFVPNADYTECVCGLTLADCKKDGINFLDTTMCKCGCHWKASDAKAGEYYDAKECQVKPCPKGTAQWSTGQTSCKSCNYNYYCNTALYFGSRQYYYDYTDNAKKLYTATSGQQYCSVCNNGSVSSDRTTCVCNKGYYFDSTSKQCVACGAGSTTASTGATAKSAGK